MPQLDYDSVFFARDGSSIGAVFDIYGRVDDPMYALRFGSAEEAARFPEGTHAFYAPNFLRFTKRIFTNDLAA